MARKINNNSRISAVSYMRQYKPTSTVEQEVGGKYITWGKNNKYPEFLNRLADESPVLNSILNGLVDYVIGQGITFNSGTISEVNVSGDTLQDVFAKCTNDYIRKGNGFVQINYNPLGQIAEIYHVSADNCRLNKDGNKVFVCENWQKHSDNNTVYNSLGTLRKNINEGRQVLPEETIEIFHFKNKYNTSIYGKPIYHAAIKNIETDCEIHLRNYATIKNDFTGSMMISYINGADYTPEQRDEITREIKDTFSGSENAGNIIMNFEQADFKRLQSEKIGEQYEVLTKTNSEAIYTSMRIIPQLFGVMTAATGFSSQEFEEAFEIMNATLIAPMQNELKGFFEKIFGKGNVSTSKFIIRNGVSV